MTADPQKLDQDLTRFLKSAHRLRWATITALGILAVAAIIVLSVVVIAQQNEIRSSCDFYRPLSSLAPTIVKPATRPSKIGVQILFGSRIAYGGSGCGSPLPKEPPGLSHWVKYYGLRP